VQTDRNLGFSTIKVSVVIKLTRRAPLLPHAPPSNIFSPFPDAKLSLANALSVTVLLESGSTSLSKFDLPLQSLSSNVIWKPISLAQPPAALPHLPPSCCSGLCRHNLIRGPTHDTVKHISLLYELLIALPNTSINARVMAFCRFLHVLFHLVFNVMWWPCGWSRQLLIAVNCWNTVLIQMSSLAIPSYWGSFRDTYMQIFKHDLDLSSQLKVTVITRLLFSSVSRWDLFETCIILLVSLHLYKRKGFVQI
jgi:hypothetical protein